MKIKTLSTPPHHTKTMTSSTPSSPSPRSFIFPKPPISSTSSPASDDIDQFSKTLQNIKSKNVRPDLLPSIISHFASKFLPDLSPSSASSTTAAWLKKRDLVENLVSALPPDKSSMPCDFLLRLLRNACMVGAGPVCLDELEARVASQLDQATLKEVMIPGFSHTCGTLLDVGLMVRMVRRFFMELDEAARSGASMVKVGKLVDLYLAEVGLDSALSVQEFEELAKSVPAHARPADDGLYRAVDTYIKAHPSTSKKEKKLLIGLIDPRKLTPEAALHAIHNDRLPVRSIIQILFSEQSKLNRVSEWNNTSFNAARSPNNRLEAPGRCPSKREVLAQQHEMRRLRDDVTRLQNQCRALQAQIERSGLEKKKRGFFKWGNLLFRNSDGGERWNDDYDVGTERRTPRTPMEGRKGKMMHKGTPKWRNSLS